MILISKICAKCKENKTEDFYYKASTTKDKLDVYCKVCRKSKSKNFFINNEDYMTNYNNQNKEILSQYYSSRYEENKESILQQRKEYSKNNRDIINKNYRKRYNEDPLYKLQDLIRSSINHSFRNKGYTKNSKSYQILGCSWEEVKLYLENKFESWMTWEIQGLYNGTFNYGWDIDHIIPISSAKTEEELLKLNHFSNLQPLCSKINRDIKKDKINFIK